MCPSITPINADIINTYSLLLRILRKDERIVLGHAVVHGVIRRSKSVFVEHGAAAVDTLEEF
jgi:hypothetical protein